MLAASPKPELRSSLTDEGIKLVLKLAADACERLDEAEQDRDLAAMHTAQLRSLLHRVTEVLDTQPAPAEGGTWEAYTLAEEVRRALAAEPPAARIVSSSSHRRRDAAFMRRRRW